MSRTTYKFPVVWKIKSLLIEAICVNISGLKATVGFQSNFTNHSIYVYIDVCEPHIYTVGRIKQCHGYKRFFLYNLKMVLKYMYLRGIGSL